MTHNTPLTSAEISQIWASYLQDTMAICELKYFFETVEDPDISSLLQHALELSQSHIPQLTDFFNGENWPVPYGFTETDVHLSAPRMYTDYFMLNYLQQMGAMGVNAYSASIGMSVRSDIRAYFSACMTESIDLHTKTIDLLLERGMFIRPPGLTPPDHIDFVTQQSFLGRWIGEERPLTAMEIANLYANVQRNTLGTAMLTGFSQAIYDQEIRQYIFKGKEIAAKHTEVLSSKLNQDDLPASVTSDIAVTESTIAPFSDKLMMYHTTSLIALGIGYYGASMATSPRKDLITDYTRLIGEVMAYSGEGAKIMIKNGWMEEPPQAPDRDQLAKKKNTNE